MPSLRPSGRQALHPVNCGAILFVRPDKRKSEETKPVSFDDGFGAVQVARLLPRWQLSAGAVFKGDWMHYYQFHIGDYASHTSHLDEIEDLAYRRMLDYCYLNEIGLPESVEEVARLIRMRSHCERIANVLREFFTLHDDGVWRHERIEAEITTFHGKSSQAKDAARKRWEKAHANAMRPHSERNANQEPRTKNQEPIKEIVAKPQRKQFVRPSVEDVAEYVSTRSIQIDPQGFIDHYDSNGWKVGRNPMIDWRAAVRTWEKRERAGGSAKAIRPKDRSLEDHLNNTSWAE